MTEMAREYSGSGLTAGYQALYNKKIPLDGAVIIRAMLAWVSSCPASASEAAPIYIQQSKSKPMRLINGDGDADLYKNCRLRLVLANTQHSGEGTGSKPQQMLLPRHLYRLGHLLTCYKYQTPGTLIELSADDRHYQGHFSPYEFICGRLGLSLSGSAYSLLEQDLATLATTMVHLQERSPQGGWHTRHSYPLIQRLDTGRVTSTGGRLDIHQAARRRQFWNVELGQPLVAMLNTSASELTVTMPPAWGSAGKNQTAQWLALFAESHGYDGRTVFDHNIGTLLQRTRLTQSKAGELVAKLTNRTQRQSQLHAQPSQQSLFTPNSQTADPVHLRTSSQLLDAVRVHGQRVRSGARRINIAIERLMAGAMYRDCSVVSWGNANRRSGRQHITTTLLNKMRLIHWPSQLQQSLHSLTYEARQTAATLMKRIPSETLHFYAATLASILTTPLPLYQLKETLTRRLQLLTIDRAVPI